MSLIPCLRIQGFGYPFPTQGHRSRPAFEYGHAQSVPFCVLLGVPVLSCTFCLWLNLFPLITLLPYIDIFHVSIPSAETTDVRLCSFA